MRPAPKSPVALGFRAGRGGSVVVGVDADGPRVALSTFLATAAEGDRLAYEPYHVAAEMAGGAAGDVPAEAAAAVAEGRRRQAELAATGLDAILQEVRDAGSEPVVAALLVNRVGWITDLLSFSLSPYHPPVAEGLAVRDALRSAFGRCGLRVAEMDEKSLHDVASAVLSLPPGEGLDARLKALGAAVGGPWRKEHKLACLAAWVALAAS